MIEKRSFVKTILLFVLLAALAVGMTACSAESKIRKNFSLSHETLTLLQGQSELLSVKNLDRSKISEYSVAWKSDKPEVASVREDGTVTAVGVGSCKVTVTVKTDGGSVDYVCTVAVAENKVAAEAVSFTNVLFTVGLSETLNLNNSISLYPENAIMPDLVWITSDPSIATVAGGVVIPVSTGNVLITATTGTGLNASCTVQVGGGFVSDDPTLKLNETQIILAPGETYQLGYTVMPKDALLTWSTSDDTILAVFENSVTALIEGEATVTVSLTHAGKQITAECKVIVAENSGTDIPARVITIEQDTVTVFAGLQDEYSFDYRVEPINHTDTVVWGTNRSDLLTIDEQTGIFRITGSPEELTSVLVTCTAGLAKSVAVVHIHPAVTVELPQTLAVGTLEPENVKNLTPEISVSAPVSYQWVSSNDAIASVDANGAVTGKTAGTCKITVSCVYEGFLFTAECEVTVTESTHVCVKIGDTVPFTKPEGEFNVFAPAGYVEIDKENGLIKALKSTDGEILEIGIEGAESVRICILAS